MSISSLHTHAHTCAHAPAQTHPNLHKAHTHKNNEQAYYLTKISRTWKIKPFIFLLKGISCPHT